MQHFWTAALSVGGLGSVGAFVFWSLYKGWLRLGIFEKLTSDQTFKIMIIFLVLTFTFCSIALASFLLQKGPAPNPHAAYPPLTLESLNNATYTVGDDTETLQNGGRHFVGPNNQDPVDMDLIEQAFGDLDGDGNQDAAVIISVNWGGTGVFTYLVPVLNVNGAPDTETPGVELGDRSLFKGVSIRDKMAKVVFVTRGPHDAFCCPTQMTERSYEFKNKSFICADECPAD